MSRLFLTGASGFIGGEIVKIAVASGHDVTNFDIKGPNLADQAPFWTEGDIRNRNALLDAIVAAKPDFLIHLASDTDVSITNIDQFTTTLKGTKNILDSVKSCASIRKFVHVSTQFVVKPGVSPASETDFEPYTLYGHAKAETERMVRAAELQVPWLIIRPTIIWGPHHPSFRENIFRHIAARHYLHPVGRKKILRAFGYVTNTADQILTLALNDLNDHGRRVYYVGDGTLDYDLWADSFSEALTGKPVRRVPLWLLSALGRIGDIAKLLHLPAPIDSGRAFRMSTSSAVDLSPTIAITGRPALTLEQGVRETVEWLRKEE